MINVIKRGTCSILDYSMPFGNIIDENFKSLCILLRIFETRIAIMIMTSQHQHHDCEEDITIIDIIKIIAQPYTKPQVFIIQEYTAQYIWAHTP